MMFLGKGKREAEETQKENSVAQKIGFPRLLLQIVKGFERLIKFILVLHLVFSHTFGLFTKKKKNV